MIFSGIIPILIAAIIGLIILFWHNSMRAREIAVDAGKNMCGQHGLQLLDDTVAIKKIALARDETGKLQIKRIYHFEYCDELSNRKIGSIKLCGICVAEITYQLENNNVIILDFNQSLGNSPQTQNTKVSGDK